MSISRRAFAAAGGALLAGLAPAAAQTEDEMRIGAADAPVSLVEYASTTCPHCAAFHEENWPALKTRFVDTGRVRLTMREMLTPPAGVALALFQLARAQGADANEYFRRLAIIYQRQRAFFEAGSAENLRAMLVALGRDWGLSEAQVNASISDPSGVAHLRRSIEEARVRGVAGTPTFYLNGARITDPSFLTPTGMARILTAAAG